MHTNLEVAELVALLRRHGISPDEARANSSRSAVPTAAALSSSAAAGTNAANPPAPANEPEEAPSDEIGFVHCTNCHAQIALYAAPAAAAAANVAPAAGAANPVPVAPVVSSSRSLSPRWYAVTRGRQVGVIYARWDPTIKDLTNGVPDWTAVRFSTEAQARRRYAEEESAGRVMTFVDPPPTD
ncbi:hypothetical protein EYR40_006850 [Pleurotus pulmonarius]|nr:hypothetical protein EYR40_006850 [Pleurotus pulmonarius]